MMILAVLLPTVIGYLIVCAVYKQSISFIEKVALGFLIGTSFMTLQMFVYSLVGIKFGMLWISLPWFLLLPLIIFADRKISFSFNGWKQIELLLLLLVSMKVIYVFFEALIKPVFGYDAIWNFSLRAKIFFFEKMIPFVKLNPYFLGDGMKNYPPHLPLLEAWTYITMNTWDDVKMKIIFPLYFCSLLIIFYKALLREKNRAHSLFFTFLLSSFPLLTYHATIEYADFIVGTYFLGAVIYLYEFFKEGKTKHLFISALLAASCGWIKEEGLVFYFICFFVFFAYNKFKNLKNLGIYLIPFFVFIFPWTLTKKVLGLELGNTHETIFKFEKLFNFHQEAIWKIAYKTFLTDNWHLFPITMIVFLVFYYRNVIATKKRYILACFVLAWLFFIYLYLFTYNWENIMNDIILSRNYLTYFPIGLFLMALTFSFSSFAPKNRTEKYAK
ncbi:hypothetical protein A2290_05375 [candidate division WOR-1 bacterium RIFOXYB2_FULL_36_35]|uniref:Glycosyltransferase RgtA/B/C/D-like domain-containing protein n=1 Tax=candidate division WOR-1 bacterium RIFOXYB2_FULL_36_35 TaxID=1802578 RepID=A0A1F4S7P1_UNCSA|nr:MAG: hypothetical protein A2290_05375 [candidate division WOR-1 bacterium RIFOXYB2_FULL_36_35]OGC21108.1 MAG: hypothetical protein A2282_03705 [candidate division WOR-1 bacterium RIFOXYA12_FULL_36_13]